MLSRREFFAVVSAAAGAALIERASAEKQGHHHERSEPEDYTRYVNVFVGTGGHGHCFPGATMPFGAVQLSPDTGVRDWDHCSGYHYKDDAILGFSHTHLSGTGCIDMLDFLLMPAADDFHFDPSAAVDSSASYRA